MKQISKLGAIVFAFVAMATVAFAATDSDMVPVHLYVDTTIAIACDSSVTMGTITGSGFSDLATNVANCNVRTNNTNGYDLNWNSSSGIDVSGSMVSGTDAIGPLTDSEPAIEWNVPTTDSFLGSPCQFRH